MVAALILAFGLAAVVQFGLIWWRATIGTIAEQRLSDKLHAAAGLVGNVVQGKDFPTLVALHQSCPRLHREPSKLGAVRAYYRMLSLLGRCFAGIPKLAAWADSEMATCARYAAVCLDQRMQRTSAVLAEMRSY